LLLEALAKSQFDGPPVWRHTPTLQGDPADAADQTCRRRRRGPSSGTGADWGKTDARGARGRHPSVSQTAPVSDDDERSRAGRARHRNARRAGTRHRDPGLAPGTECERAAEHRAVASSERRHASAPCQGEDPQGDRQASGRHRRDRIDERIG
jgi:hypothetical protein